MRLIISNSRNQLHKRSKAIPRSSVKRRILGSMLVFLLLVFVAPAALAAPVNDDIEDAIHIRTNLKYLRGNNLNATREGEPAFENGQMALSSVWYKYRAKSDGFLVLLGEGYQFDALGIDVFNGKSFDPSDRIVSGFSERIESYYITRLIVPVVTNQLLYIRVASFAGRGEQTFAIHVHQTGVNGDVLVFPLRDLASTSPQVVYGPVNRSLNANFRRDFVYINTMRQAGNITYANFDLPTGRVQRTSDQVPGRSFEKPGVQFARVLFSGNARAGESGSWNYTFVTKVRLGSASKRFAFRIPLLRWRDNEASILHTISPRDVSTVLGMTARVVMTVENTSAFPATGCRLLAFTSTLFLRSPFEIRWRRQLPVGAFNAPFDIPAFGTENLEVLINANFEGSEIGMWPILACENAPGVTTPPQNLGSRMNILSRP